MCCGLTLGLLVIRAYTNESRDASTATGNNKREKMKYFGHIMRKEGDCLEKEMIQGTTSGKRRRGRQRMTWMDNINTWTGMTTELAIRTANNREQWKRVAHDAAESRIENG